MTAAPQKPEKLSRVPAATDYVFDAVLDRGSSLRLSFFLR
jgi:hypothetical protein